MKAILYICHGTRLKEGQQQALMFVDKCKKNIPVSIQEAAFLELASPSIEEGFQKCVLKGATEVLVVPLLLLSAGHAKEDIPNVLQDLQRKYPHVNIIYGDAFGVHPYMADILVERVNEMQTEIDKNSMVLLVGRGSSDRDAQKDFQRIAGTLEKLGLFQKVDTCYLAAAEPDFEEGLNKASNSSYKQIWIVPYLLFTGLLMNTVKKAVRKQANMYEDKNYILTNYLGYHPLLAEIIKQRICLTEGIR